MTSAFGKWLNFSTLVVHTSDPLTGKEVYEAYIDGRLPRTRRGSMRSVTGYRIEWENLAYEPDMQTQQAQRRPDNLQSQLTKEN